MARGAGRRACTCVWAGEPHQVLSRDALKGVGGRARAERQAEAQLHGAFCNELGVGPPGGGARRAMAALLLAAPPLAGAASG